jgi:ABC-type multidrug transport system ATPase subunit
VTENIRTVIPADTENQNECMSIAISITNLVKEYPQKDAPPLRAIDDISLDIEQGQIFGLLGPNGAGKSTAIKIMSTLIPPTSGTVVINGFDVVQTVPRRSKESLRGASGERLGGLPDRPQ